MEEYSSFVFKDARFCNQYDEWSFGDEAIVVDQEPRANSKPVCSGCGRRGRCYSHRETRLFEYKPSLIFKVFFAYTMRRGFNYFRNTRRPVVQDAFLITRLATCRCRKTSTDSARQTKF